MKIIRAVLICSILALAFPAHAQFSGYAPAGTVRGNATASEAEPTFATLTAMLDQAFCATQNKIPLRGASVWACGDATAAIPSAAITYAKIQNVAATSILGNPTGSPAAPAEITLGNGLAFSGTTLKVSDALVLATSYTGPLVIGGTAASSTLTLESTSGAGTTDSILFKTASQSTRFTMDTKGHLLTNGAAPAPTSCGTGPSVTGSDSAGVITMGTATPTTCTITFNVAYTSAPYCVVTWQTNIASMVYTVSNTAISLTQTATSSNKVNYVCFGQTGG